MKHPFLVSVIVNNYNYGRFLHEAIDSALKQTYSNIEVIVVDDGSTDNSREIIAGYENKIIPILKENGGQASAFNAGFAASRGDIICFLDSDDIFLPEKVAEIVNVFEHHQDLGWCFHPLKLVDINCEALDIQTYHKVSSSECDLRTRIKRGKVNGKKVPTIPATSGLCFKSSLIKLILPMPLPITIISDNYLKFTALALSKGFYLSKELVLQRIHNNNAFTVRGDKQKLLAKIQILTAYWMRINFPSLVRFTNNLFANGLGISLRVGGMETEYKMLVENYFSSVTLLEKIEINFRTLYSYLRL